MTFDSFDDTHCWTRPRNSTSNFSDMKKSKVYIETDDDTCALYFKGLTTGRRFLKRFNQAAVQRHPSIESNQLKWAGPIKRSQRGTQRSLCSPSQSESFFIVLAKTCARVCKLRAVFFRGKGWKQDYRRFVAFFSWETTRPRFTVNGPNEQVTKQNLANTVSEAWWTD